MFDIEYDNPDDQPTVQEKRLLLKLICKYIFYYFLVKTDCLNHSPYFNVSFVGKSVLDKRRRSQNQVGRDLQEMTLCRPRHDFMCVYSCHWRFTINEVSSLNPGRDVDVYLLCVFSLHRRL
jgi:hypothetical protein